jgi:hypothetical protein
MYIPRKLLKGGHNMQHSFYCFNHAVKCDGEMLQKQKQQQKQNKHKLLIANNM